MRKLFIFLFFITLSFSCNESDGPGICGVENPAENLPWLKQKIQEIESNSLSKYSYIQEAEYKGKTVFLFNSCCPFCSFVVTLVDCQGNDLGYLNQEDGIRSEDLKAIQVIWTPEDSECVFAS